MNARANGRKLTLQEATRLTPAAAAAALRGANQIKPMAGGSVTSVYSVYDPLDSIQFAADDNEDRGTSKGPTANGGALRLRAR
ncbi:hypothetical protein [Streptomyces sp. NPDC060275]|uniref:hypothetical protein n=1 Tax=Streptomyces sp. NPDC060275 TaxID=3347090 RepID=UPI003665A92E